MEAAQARLSLFMSKCHIVENLMSRLNYDYNLQIIKSPKLAPNARAHPRGTSWSVLLIASYHKEYRQIWLRGGDLYGF